MKAKFRHAGFSAEEVGEIVPAELYAGSRDDDKKVKRGNDNLQQHLPISINTHIKVYTLILAPSLLLSFRKRKLATSQGAAHKRRGAK